MTEQEQRIAIAEACGWQHCAVCKTSGGRFRKGSLIGTSPSLEQLTYVPDYLHDLNAMHEAEGYLSDRGELGLFNLHLLEVCGSIGCAMHARASQRAEAFLRATGRWKD